MTGVQPNILAMTYVAGVPIERVTQESQEIRDQIAQDLIDLTMHELFFYGVMQTDPNFANYLYQPDNQRIALLDFGATHEISAAGSAILSPAHARWFCWR